MKSLVIFGAILLALAGVGLAVHYNKNANYAQNVLNQERFEKLTAEENLEKANAKIESLTTELDRTKSKIKNISTLIEQTNSLNSDLKSRLETISKMNESLENKMKELSQQLSTIQQAPKPAGEI